MRANTSRIAISAVRTSLGSRDLLVRSSVFLEIGMFDDGNMCDGGLGVAVVTLKDAFLFTDGRYFLQAEKQLDSCVSFGIV